MKLSIRLLAAAFVVAAAPAWGQDEKKQEEKAVELTGKISKEVVKRKGKDGTEKEVTIFALTDKDGKRVVLQIPKPKKGDGTTPIKLDEYADKSVTIKGSAAETIRKGKGGAENKIMIFSKVESVTAVEAPKEEKKKDEPKKDTP